MRDRLSECGGVLGVSLQSISVVTLGVSNLERSRRFYSDGFGWKTVFENEEVLFFQMNGLVLGLWLEDKLAEDMQRAPASPGSIALAHNVGSTDEVTQLISRLAEHGGTVLRPGDAPEHGGFRGYVADPDGHAWEIAHNPAWPIDAEGHVKFSAS